MTRVFHHESQVVIGSEAYGLREIAFNFSSYNVLWMISRGVPSTKQPIMLQASGL